jgi:hypothetical protein
MLNSHLTLTKLRAGLHGMLHDRRCKAELAACPARELQRLAQDLGVDPTALLSLRRSHPGPSELMPLRLRQLGLDPAYVKVAQTATYRDLERVCAACKEWRRCARDLANGDVQAGMSGYCLNAFTMDTLMVGRPGTHRQ